MFLAAAHSYLFLCLLLSTECLVSASEQVFNPDEWRVINALNIIIIIKIRHISIIFSSAFWCINGK